MPKSRLKTDRLSDREELVLALTQARLMADSMPEVSAQYLKGFDEGIKVSIELIRSLDDLQIAVDRRPREIR